MSKKNPDTVLMWVKKDFKRQLKKKASELDMTIIEYTDKLSGDADNILNWNKVKHEKKTKKEFRLF